MVVGPFLIFFSGSLPYVVTESEEETDKFDWLVGFFIDFDWLSVPSVIFWQFSLRHAGYLRPESEAKARTSLIGWFGFLVDFYWLSSKHL